MWKKTVLFFLFILSCPGIYAQSLAKGYVFEDLNKNAKKDNRENGIPRVSVSNGKDVVLTDEKGYYELPVGDDQIIFVIKPSGYEARLNESNLPQFYYIHKPGGSPVNLKYKGVEPTGKLPKMINFGLLQVRESDAFTSLIFGDPQPNSLEEVGFFERGIISELEGIGNVSFGISLGDLAWDNLDLHKPYIDVVKKIGVTWYNVMGNHDMNVDAPADSLTDETFESNFGPASYAFNHGKAHFIIMDDILYPDPRDQRGYWGGFREDQMEFIRNDLKLVDKDRLVVLALHIPLYDEEYGDSFRDSDRQQLFDLLKDFSNVLVLSAHTHVQSQIFYEKKDGWMQSRPLHEYNVGTTCGDWHSGEINEQGVPVATMRDGTPKGYAFLRIDGNQYVIDYKVAGKTADYQMEIFNTKVVPHNKGTSSGICVNFFMGSAGDKVEYRIDNNPWREMIRAEVYDPSFLNGLLKWDNLDELLPGRRPSNPKNSTHLWAGNLPTNLSLGTHEIEVRATDMFGRVFTRKSIYKIEEPKVIGPVEN